MIVNTYDKDTRREISTMSQVPWCLAELLWRRLRSQGYGSIKGKIVNV